MAKSSGWNSLSPKQQSDFKAKNFNMKVNVTEAQLNKLRKAGTPTKAISLYKSDPKMREALNRFYGKERVAKAVGTKTRGYTNAQLEAAKKRKANPPESTKTKTKTTPTKSSTTKSKSTPVVFTGASPTLWRAQYMEQTGTNPVNSTLQRAADVGSILVPTGAALKTVKYGSKVVKAAKKIGTVAGKRAKPTTVRSVVKDVMGAGKKQTGKHAAPKVTSSGKRAKPASTPRRAKPTTVKSTVKDIAGIASRKTGARAKPPAAARRAANAESKSMRSRVTGRVVKTRTTGRHAKPRGGRNG